jgi:hypothetical protein
LASIGMTPLVFISHSSQDRRIALRVCEALERLGLGCWLASRDIGPGDNFQEAIVRAIRTVRVMVLVFTGNANNSDEIKKEIALASQNHLAVIPLRAEDVVPSDAFVYELSTRQWVDAFDDWDRAMQRLAEQISEMAAQQPMAPPAEPGGAARRGHLAIGLTVAAALALVVTGGSVYWSGKQTAPPAASGTPAGAPSPVPAVAPPAPPAASNIAGKWVTDPLTNPYDQNQKSVLHFEFEQAGGALLGTVSEKTEFGGSIRSIHAGQVTGDAIVFYTQGMMASGSDEQPYKENYHGTVKGEVIEFVRQNDVATGGVPQKFAAKRE